MTGKKPQICWRLSWSFRKQQRHDCRPCPAATTRPQSTTHQVLVDLWYLFYPDNLASKE